MKYLEIFHEHICPYCSNIYGKCSWSKDGIPVEGWKAEKHVRDGIGETYAVKSCPRFKFDGRCKKCKYGSEDAERPLPDCGHYEPKIVVYKSPTGVCEHLNRKTYKCKLADKNCNKHGCRKYKEIIKVRNQSIYDMCMNYKKREREEPDYVPKKVR